MSRRGSLSGGSLSMRGLCPRGLCPGGSLSAGSLSWRRPCTVMSKQYASYWNAFLLVFRRKDLCEAKHDVVCV